MTERKERMKDRNVDDEIVGNDHGREGRRSTLGIGFEHLGQYFNGRFEIVVRPTAYGKE